MCLPFLYPSPLSLSPLLILPLFSSPLPLSVSLFLSTSPHSKLPFLLKTVTSVETLSPAGLPHSLKPAHTHTSRNHGTSSPSTHCQMNTLHNFYTFQPSSLAASLILPLMFQCLSYQPSPMCTATRWHCVSFFIFEKSLLAQRFRPRTSLYPLPLLSLSLCLFLLCSGQVWLNNRTISSGQ